MLLQNLELPTITWTLHWAPDTNSTWSEKYAKQMRIGLVGQSLDKAQLQSSQRNSHTFYGFIEINFHLTIHPDLCPTGNVAATVLILIQRGRIQFKCQAKC